MYLQKHLTILITIISLTAFANDVKKPSFTNQEKSLAQEQFEIGMAFIYGTQVDADVKKGIEWLEYAAAQGHEKALLNLTRAYYRGYKVRKNDYKAFQWATKAAAKGIAEAQYYLGNMYLEGKGCIVDIKKGLVLIQESQQQGYAKADEQLRKYNKRNA